jgi:hypothetical protein
LTGGKARIGSVPHELAALRVAAPDPERGSPARLGLGLRRRVFLYLTGLDQVRLQRFGRHYFIS